MLLRFNGNLREVIFVEETGNTVWTTIDNLFNKSTLYAYWMNTRLTLLGCTARQARLFGYNDPKSLQNKPLEHLTLFKQHPHLGKKIKDNNMKALKSAELCLLCKEIYEDTQPEIHELLTYKLLIQDNQTITGLLSLAVPCDYSLLKEFISEGAPYPALQEVISNTLAAG
jgi:hypothetical protein